MNLKDIEEKLLIIDLRQKQYYNDYMDIRYSKGAKACIKL